MSNIKESNTVSGGKVWVRELPAVQAKVDKRVELAGYLGLIGPIIALIFTFIYSNATVETTNNSMTFIPYNIPLSTTIIMAGFGILGIFVAIYTRELMYFIIVCFVTCMMIIASMQVGPLKAFGEKHQVLEDLLISQGYTIPEGFSFSKMPDETVTTMKKDNEIVYLQWNINQDKTKYSFKEIDMPEN